MKKRLVALVVSLVTVCQIMDPSLAIAARGKAKAKRKPGVVLKQEGYYLKVEKRDKVMVKPTAEAAEAAAISKGYIPAEEHFKKTCDDVPGGITVLKPGEAVTIPFSLNPNLATEDETVTSKFALEKGFYRVRLACRDNRPAFITSFPLPSLHVNYNGNAEAIQLVELSTKSTGIFYKLKGKCTDGFIEITQLQ